MKTTRRTIRTICILIAVILVICMTPRLPVSAATRSSARQTNQFYQQLAQLINEQDDSFYFDSMELTIGSDILTVDGDERQMDVTPDVQNQRTMLPIRAVAEAAGATVDYDAESGTAVILGTYGEEILCPIGASTMSVNSRSYQLDAPSYAKDGRTYLPVRAVSEALNLDVEWEQEASTVTITAPYQTARVLAWADGDLDVSGLDANTVLYDGENLWVLQFDTAAEAAAAVERLTDDGVMAEPDTYIPPIDDIDEGDIYSTTSNYSWGVSNCGFDTFVTKNKNLLSGSEIVAVVDTGVDATHPFLRGRVVSGYDFVDGDSDAGDGQYHGTHVAGIIVDCAGGAPVEIMPIRAMDANGSGYDSWIAAGIIYATHSGADVINLSLGGKGNSSAIDNAISYAIGEGVTVVAAAGNEATDTYFYCPAHIDEPGALVA